MVMVAVFAIFATLGFVDMKMVGIGLAVAIIFDVTIVRVMPEAPAAPVSTQPPPGPPTGACSEAAHTHRSLTADVHTHAPAPALTDEGRRGSATRTIGARAPVAAARRCR